MKTKKSLHQWLSLIFWFLSIVSVAAAIGFVFLAFCWVKSEGPFSWATYSALVTAYTGSCITLAAVFAVLATFSQQQVELAELRANLDLDSKDRLLVACIEGVNSQPLVIPNDARDELKRVGPLGSGKPLSDSRVQALTSRINGVARYAQSAYQDPGVRAQRYRLIRDSIPVEYHLLFALYLLRQAHVANKEDKIARERADKLVEDLNFSEFWFHVDPCDYFHPSEESGAKLFKKYIQTAF